MSRHRQWAPNLAFAAAICFFLGHVTGPRATPTFDALVNAAALFFGLMAIVFGMEP